MEQDKEFKEFCVTIQTLIEAGSIAEAQSELMLNESKFTLREQKLMLAHFYKRARLPDRSILLLRPYVRSSSKNPIKATDGEKLEYASALTLLDATKEARKLLDTVSVKTLDDYLLFTAFNCIREWDYLSAIEPLEKYISQISDSYKKAIGTINLLQSYISCAKLDLAKQLIDEGSLEKFLVDKSKLRLLGNFYELTAQLYFQKKDWDLAESALKSAQKFSLNNKSVDDLFVNKWKLLVDMHRGDGEGNFKDRWLEMRSKAYALAHFETVRDLDFHYALCSRSDDILSYVYWGTPYEGFREKLRNSYRDKHSKELHIEDSCQRPIFKEREKLDFNFTASKVPRFDSAQIKEQAHLIKDSLELKLFDVLNADFYKEASAYFIFEKVYEDEFFNPNSSPAKIRQVVYRLKDTLKQMGAPITVSFEERGYLLVPSDSDCVIIDSKSRNSYTRHHDLLEKIKKVFANEAFKAKDLIAVVEISARSVANALKDMLEDGELEKMGSGPNTSYRLKK